jgi:hypothetical protein
MNEEHQLSSIDRLIDLGMSMAVAQQMMQMMNHAIQAMPTPQYPNTAAPMGQPVQYYALVEDIPQGPFTDGQLSTHILSGKVTRETLVWMPGLPGWMQAQQVPEILRIFSNVPPPL